MRHGMFYEAALGALEGLKSLEACNTNNLSKEKKNAILERINERKKIARKCLDKLDDMGHWYEEGIIAYKLDEWDSTRRCAKLLEGEGFWIESAKLRSLFSIKGKEEQRHLLMLNLRRNVAESDEF